MTDATSDVQAIRSTGGTWRPSPQAAGERKGLALDRYFTRAGESPFDAVEWEPRSAVAIRAVG